VLSIVVPVYNGEANLVSLVERIKTLMPSINSEWELIFIDDGSSDGSLQLMKRLSESNPRIGWISLQNNVGQQLAVLCGLRHSRGDYVVTMDDDLQHPPELITSLYKEVSAGFDAVYAVADESRRTGGVLRGGALRDMFFTLFLKKPAGLRIGSFRILNRKALESVCGSGSPFVYISAELFRSQLNIKSIGYKKRVESPAVSDSRYTLASRIKLYLKLVFYYGPLSPLRSFSDCEQYVVENRGGCL
jgi:undecaprenyl-phosphate 4-deoxy-4-formamido-L-arabinose transferase